MTNPIFSKYLSADIESVKSSALALSDLSHLGEKGFLREVIFSKMLAKYIPEPFRLTSGFITDHRGNQSNQIDVIIYNPYGIPPVLIGEKGFVPLESNFINIEIKSVSTIAGLRTSAEKSNSIRNLKYVYHEQHDHTMLPRNLFIYFGYSSDCLIETEFERYKGVDADYLTNPKVDMLCIANKGCYSWNQITNNQGDTLSRWMHTPSLDGNELIHCISFITNTLLVIMNGRNFDYIKHAPFGHYVAEKTVHMNSRYIEGLYIKNNGYREHMDRTEAILECGAKYFGEIPGDYEYS